MREERNREPEEQVYKQHGAGEKRRCIGIDPAHQELMASPSSGLFLGPGGSNVSLL